MASVWLIPMGVRLAVAGIAGEGLQARLVSKKKLVIETAAVPTRYSVAAEALQD